MLLDLHKVKRLGKAIYGLILASGICIAGILIVEEVESGIAQILLILSIMIGMLLALAWGGLGKKKRKDK